MATGLTIGEVAREAGVAATTLRYYEQIGLVAAAARVGGQRRYDGSVLAPTEEDFVLFDVALLRLRALLARARGDEASYRDFAERYSTAATAYGFEGHMASS
jgi:hypothetical protein